MKSLGYLLFPACVAPPAFAQTVDTDAAPLQADFELTCAFTTECFDLEGCDETAFTASLEGRAGGQGATAFEAVANLVTDAEILSFVGTLADDVFALHGSGTGFLALLTISNGSARFTVHNAGGPMTITYGGTCE